MKVKFWNNNNANIHSKKTDIFDLEKDLGLSDEEWNEIPEDDKYEMVKDWAMERFDYGFEEIE